LPLPFLLASADIVGNELPDLNVFEVYALFSTGFLLNDGKLYLSSSSSSSSSSSPLLFL